MFGIGLVLVQPLLCNVLSLWDQRNNLIYLGWVTTTHRTDVLQNERCVQWGLLGTRNLSSILGIWGFFENFSTQFLARFWGHFVYFESHFARYLRILINEDLMSRSWKLTCVGFCLVLSYLRRVTVSSEPTSQTKYILCGKTWVRWIMIINPASSLPNPLSAPKSILRIKCRTLLQQIYKTICYFILYLISIFNLINMQEMFNVAS